MTEPVVQVKPARWLQATRTLRFRWAVWTAIVVLLTASLTMLGLRQGVQYALLHEMDQILEEDLREISLAIEATPKEEFHELTASLERKALGHKHHGWFVRLIDADQQFIWSSPDAPNQRLLRSGAPVGPTTIQNYRLVQREAPNRNGQPISAIRVGAKLDLLWSDMRRIDRMVLLTLSCVVVVAPLLGYWFAGRAARTVGEIIYTAANLRPNRLSDRLRVHGTGDELDVLSITVNRLLDRIAEYIQQRGDFLANAAHELRSPLAAIRSSVEVALQSGRSAEEYEELLLDVIDQSASLETLVNQLLLLAEMEADSKNDRFERVRFNEVVMRSVDMFDGVAESKGINLECWIHDEVDVQGQRYHLRQVINNLLDNAIKYSSTGDRIEVELRFIESTKQCELMVRDTGVGIAESDLPRVFERFFRADRSRSRDPQTTPGVGLGLSICQAVILMHGGTIVCQSVLERGTTFIVRLPATLAEVAEIV